MRLKSNLGGALSAAAIISASLGAATLGAASAAQAAVTLTNTTLFDADASGSNTSASNGSQILRGAWTTVLDQTNVAGNFGGEMFLSRVVNPTASDFLTPAAALSAALNEGTNTFYFWVDSDDTAGGTAGFGLNLFLSGAGANSPSISAFVVPGVGGTAVADGTSDCTAGYAFTCVAGTGSLSTTIGATHVSLTDFQVFARGGGAGGEDRVNSTNTAPFTPPAHADGINDTYGSFTLNLRTPTSATPEPASWALMIGGFGLAGAVLRRRRAAA